MTLTDILNEARAIEISEVQAEGIESSVQKVNYVKRKSYSSSPKQEVSVKSVSHVVVLGHMMAYVQQSGTGKEKRFATTAGALGHMMVCVRQSTGNVRSAKSMDILRALVGEVNHHSPFIR